MANPQGQGGSLTGSVRVRRLFQPNPLLQLDLGGATKLYQRQTFFFNILVLLGASAASCRHVVAPDVENPCMRPPGVDFSCCR